MESNLNVGTELYINGAWVQSAGDVRFKVYNPATEEEIASVSSAAEADAKQAIEAAYKAGSDWRGRSPRQRSEILRKAFDLMNEHKQKIASLISLEEGKPIKEALGEVAYAAEFFRWYAEEAVRNTGILTRSPSGTNNILVQHQPVGVCLLITPWNFPAAMITRKIAPALAAGCTTILKPACETPLTALLLADLLEEAGVPPGVVNVIPSANAAMIAEVIMNDDRVKKISFTGSTRVGRLLLKKASERVVNCSMELGGNAPFIVMDDADLDVAIESAVVAKMRNAGESCIGANRFYVHNSIIDEFSKRFALEMEALKIGGASDEDCDVGPLISAEAVEKVEDLVDDATKLGANVLIGGKRLGGKGHYYLPTVITNIPPTAKILQEEIFGPVAPIIGFDTVDEVSEKANQTELGLAAYIISGDVGRALSLSSQIDAGVIGLNRGFISDPAAPFGGMKQSGIGREGGQEGILEFLEKKYIAVDW